VRIYDAVGEEAKVELTFNFNLQEACEVDMLERTLNTLDPEENKLGVILQPFEIKTLLIKRAEPV
jgi:alpha-mannosidase